MPTQSVGVLWLGWSRAAYAGMPLPISLQAYGMPGCSLLAEPLLPLVFPTGSGTQTFPFGMPLLGGLVGKELTMQAAVAQSSANASGIAWSHGLAATVGPMPAATSLVSSISQFGITYDFASPVRAGRFANGDWFVIGPVQLTGMTPACTTVGGRTLHGAMINPDPSTRDHGYDSALYGSGSSQLYHPSWNVALGLSAASPLTLQPNQSLVKVVSNTNTSLLPHLRTCSVLTCLATVPPADSFRPPYAGTDHEVRYDVTHLDWSALASLQPATGMPSIAAEADQFERPWLDSPGWPSRYIHPIDNMPDYGRDLCALYNQGTLMCNVALPQQSRRELLIRLVQIGIDFWGNCKNGARWEGTGGHGSGRKWPILFAGRLLQDAEMLDVGHSHRTWRGLNGNFDVFFGEDGQTFYVQQTGTNQYNWGHGGYSAQHVGLPDFGFSHVHWPANDDCDWNGDPYRQCCTANAWIGGVLCARIMGLVQAWNHPPLFDYMDRYVTVETSGWTYSWRPWAGSMWSQYRSSY